MTPFLEFDLKQASVYEKPHDLPGCHTKALLLGPSIPSVKTNIQDLSSSSSSHIRLLVYVFHEVFRYIMKSFFYPTPFCISLNT